MDEWTPAVRQTMTAIWITLFWVFVIGFFYRIISWSRKRAKLLDARVRLAEKQVKESADT